MPISYCSSWRLCSAHSAPSASTCWCTCLTRNVCCFPSSCRWRHWGITSSTSLCRPIRTSPIVNTFSFISRRSRARLTQWLSYWLSAVKTIGAMVCGFNFRTEQNFYGLQVVPDLGELLWLVWLQTILQNIVCNTQWKQPRTPQPTSPFKTI